MQRHAGEHDSLHDAAYDFAFYGLAVRGYALYKLGNASAHITASGLEIVHLATAILAGYQAGCAVLAALHEFTG